MRFDRECDQGLGGRAVEAGMMSTFIEKLALSASVWIQSVPPRILG
jgi:hypothetical protein